MQQSGVQMDIYSYLIKMSPVQRPYWYKTRVL